LFHHSAGGMPGSRKAMLSGRADNFLMDATDI
jgi:hypothetical protein